MKLKCNAIQRLLSDYIDDTLLANDAAKVEAHLQFCPNCQHEYAALKKTRDLVVDYYVEPIASDSYLHQFEVELNRCIERKGPTSLSQHLKTAISQYVWCLLTQLRRSFCKYSGSRMHALSVCTLLLLIVSGLVTTHILNQKDSIPDSMPPKGTPGFQVSVGETDTLENSRQLLHEHRTNRKDPSEVSSPSNVTDSQKAGYWKLSEPLSTEAEEHLIVMHISNDRSVPSDADSDMLSYEQPEILKRKSPIEGEKYVTLPLEINVVPFADKYPRKQRKLSGFVVKLMHVSTEMLTIPEFYDLIKL